MENREIRVLETPVDKVKVEIKTWITAREKRAISSVLTSRAKFNSGEKKFELDPGLMVEIQDETLKTVVISVGEKTENIIEALLDFKAEDYDFVVKAVDAIVNPEVKKN